MPSRPTIVCAVDHTPRAAGVATFAAELAAAVGARLVLGHVFDPMTIPMPPSREEHLLETTEALAERERGVRRQALLAVSVLLGDAPHEPVLTEGDERDGVVALVEEHEAQMLVLGTPRLDPLERVLQGSLAADVAFRAPCPVVVVPDGADPDLSGPVVVAFDGSEQSLRAARHGAALAAAMGRGLVLVHVAEQGGLGVPADEELERELQDAARACASDEVDIEVEVDHGDPVQELTRAARERDASVVVAGTRGRNAVAAALLGSVSAGLVRGAGRPVVVVGPAAARTVTAPA